MLKVAIWGIFYCYFLFQNEHIFFSVTRKKLKMSEKISHSVGMTLLPSALGNLLC